LSERLSSLQKDCARYETIWNESATRRDVLSLAARIASDLTSSSSSSSSSPAKRKRVRVGLCLGLGSLEGEGGGWEGRRRAWMQLFAFEGLVRGLDSGEEKGRLRTVLQDPVFTEGDRMFLSGRGHEVLEDPGGFKVLRRVEEGMDKKEEEGEGEAKAEKEEEEEEEEEDGTLLFGVHLYLPVYKRALESGLPAVFVGTGWDTWDE